MKITCRKEHPAEEHSPLLHKVQETPKGLPKAAVRTSQEWTHGDDIPLSSDCKLPGLASSW